MDRGEARSSDDDDGGRPGLRERKAAATRLAIVESLRRRLAGAALADLTVEQLAEDANVSRMTFFNYFPTKEHAVDLLMVVWLFGLEERIAAQKLRGVAAIDTVFSWAGDDLAESPARMRRIHAYFASRPGDRPLPPLGRAERIALASTPGALPPEPVGLGRLFIRLVEEAAADGDVSLHGSSYEVAHFLGSVLQGACVVGHSSPDTDWQRLFRRHARRALGLLDAEGFVNPPPVRVPSQYRAKSRREAPRTDEPKREPSRTKRGSR